VIRRQVVHVGEAYKKIYIVPGTPVSVSGAGAEQKSNGGYLRDDTEQMEDLARLFAAYHTVPRKSVTITNRYVIGTFNIGNLISTANSVAIGAIVSKIQIDAPLGSSSSPADVTQQVIATSVPVDLLATLEYIAGRQ
jgi:hypothetical protein